jgi:hypothetical protein
MLKTVGMEEAELVNLVPRVGDRDWLRMPGTENGTYGSRRAVVHACPHSPAEVRHPGRRQQSSSIESGRATATEPDPELLEMRQRVTALETELAAARRLIEVLQNMKVVRWTEWPRRIVYRLRDRRR